MADGDVTIRIEQALVESAKAAAASRGVGLDDFVREAIAEHIRSEAEMSDDADPRIDELIAREAARTGATMRWADIEPWVRAWGSKEEPPPPQWRK